MDDASRRAGGGSKAFLLLLSVFIIATCGLVYELVAGTLASYLLGDSVTQFSTVIGVYLFSMGVGSWLSKFLGEPLLRWFILIEVLVGLVGGWSAPFLFLLFEFTAGFRVLLYTLVGLTGMLVGAEIPMLMRILQDRYSFKELVSRVFAVDYIGALIASLAFPLLLVPHLGMLRTSLFFGLLNVGVAWALLLLFYPARKGRPLMTLTTVATLSLIAGFIWAERITSFAEQASYGETIVHSKSTPYQRMVVTHSPREWRLYLNGNLQFSSADEYRYHEALVHPGAQGLSRLQNVLVLGGGDGFAARELLRYPSVKTITLVDLDPAMTSLFSRDPAMTRLNGGALRDPRVRIRNTDAFGWVRNDTAHYDFVVVDFPDPGNFSVGKLYSLSFYQELAERVSPGGAVVVQCTSPFVARQSFWCIVHTLQAAGFSHTVPYHAHVPSFGAWGFTLAMKTPAWRVDGALPKGLRYLDSATLRAQLLFPADMAEVPTDINRLNNQVLVHLFEREWAPYLH